MTLSNLPKVLEIIQIQAIWFQGLWPQSLCKILILVKTKGPLFKEHKWQNKQK